jgi:hypothetical protein
MSARKWIMERIKSDDDLMALVAGGVYDGIAPKGSPYPNIDMTCVSMLQTENAFADRLRDRGLWRIRYIDKSISAAKADSAGEIIQSLFHKVYDEANDIIASTFEQSRQFTQDEDGEIYQIYIVDIRVETR